jgi:hypothetical protein
VRALRIIDRLGSWWLTAGLLLAFWMAYLALSFGRNPYPAWVALIFRSPGGVAIYTALIVNLLCASIRIAAARLRRRDLPPDRADDYDIHGSVPLRAPDAFQQAADLVRSRIGPAVQHGRSIRHLTGTWSFLPGMVFRSGLVLVLAGLMVSSHARRSSDASFRVDERKELLGATVKVTEVQADLPADHLQVGEDGNFLLEGVSASLATDGAVARVTPGFPARVNGTWYRIRHLGYSQELTVSLHGRQAKLNADLDLLPPGRSASVPLPGSAQELLFSLDPARTITKGLLTGKQYNLARPVYRVSLRRKGSSQEGKAHAGIHSGARAVIGTVPLVLGEQGLSVRLQAVQDPGLLLLYTGSLVLLAGLGSLVSRFFWYEREFVIEEREGTLFAGARDEFFSRWGVERFQRWLDAYAERNRP